MAILRWFLGDQARLLAILLMLLGYLILLLGLLRGFGARAPEVSRGRRLAVWLPFVLGLAAGLYIVFGPLVESGTGPRYRMGPGGRPVLVAAATLRHLSLYQDHFRHAGIFILDLDALYVVSLLFLARLTALGKRSSVLLAGGALILGALFSGSPVLLFLPALILALILAPKTRRGRGIRN